jgi:hypothetical protein
MSDHVARVVIDHSVQSGKETGKAQAAKEANRDAAAQIRARRKQIHDQAERDMAGARSSPEPSEPIDAPVREDVEAIEIPLRDGRIIEYGPPVGISITDRIARLYSSRPPELGGPDPGATESRLTRILLGVRSIDGRPVQAMTDLIQRTALANRLGDEAIDLLFYFDRLHWPPLTQAELPLIKKKLRT